jgi:hypothetical protein
LHGTAQAQQRDTARTKRDTVRGARDTIPIARDTAAKRDTTRAVRVPIPPGADSLLQRDSLLRADSARAAVPVIEKDSIKSPIASAEAPVMADPSGSFVWDRRDVFSTGALTLQDLLDRVPGLTGLRAGWIAEPMISSFLGDPRRVRVFLDGLELEDLDPRMGRIWDLSQIPLWALDDVRVERGASEVRIHLRSWRVDRTTPYTRTDVYTGDQGTNLYRGMFGRRYQHGEVLQLAGQQYGTDPGRLQESSDQLGVLARLGWARRNWSGDALLLRGDRHRGRTLTSTIEDTIPDTESTRTEAYARFGWGRSDPGGGLWVQALASSSKYAFGGKSSSLTPTTTPETDTSRSRAQYVVTGGYSMGPFRASFTQRYLVGMGRRLKTPSARLGYETRFLTVSALGEGRGLDSARRFEASAVVRPLRFLYLAGAASTEQPRAGATGRFLRAEAGVRLRDVWLSGGLLRRDSTLLEAPLIFRSNTPAVMDSSAEALFATVRGRLWKAVYVDAHATQWSDSGSFYRPKYQTRAELYVSTSMLNRFPSGNFHILASAVHEYQSSSLWPDAGGTIRLLGYRTISTLIQVRILEAEVFWNLRNILGERYQQVPGYILPRITNIYGVRWEFWN